MKDITLNDISLKFYDLKYSKTIIKFIETLFQVDIMEVSSFTVSHLCSLPPPAMTDTFKI